MFGGATTSELLVESWLEVELYETMPLNFVVEPHAPYIPFEYSAEETLRCGRSRRSMQTIRHWTPGLRPTARRAAAARHMLCSIGSISISTANFSTRSGATGVLAPSELLRSGRGSPS